MVILLVLFGGNRIPEVMRGLGQGVRSFKEGMREDSPGVQSSVPAPRTDTTSSPAALAEKK